MTEKNGILTFKCDDDKPVSSQRDNRFNLQELWKDKYPKNQCVVKGSTMCNFTSYINALFYAGWIFPSGPYEQPEDNFAYFFFTDPRIDEYFKKTLPAPYALYKKGLEGKCTDWEVKNSLTPPNEFHDILSYGANLWLNFPHATTFSENINFLKCLWRYLVVDNLPIVVSTTFGGFGHIVTVTGVQYDKSSFEEGKKFYNETKIELPEITPKAIIIDDSWGKYNPKTNKYDSAEVGNDIIIPWDVVVAKVKPCGSDKTKRAHTFRHGATTI